MAINIDSIKQLREETGLGVLECKRALELAHGEYQKALGSLREKAQAVSVKRTDRPVTQGRLELYSHGNGRIGVMVEINTETDFASRSETFRTFAHEVALQIAAAAPQYVRDEDIPAQVLEEEAERAAAMAREQGKPEAIVSRIVEGYLKKYKDEHVLLRQVYIRDDKLRMAQLLSQTASAVGENVIIQRFARWEMGDGKDKDEG